jgi:hypothetical protein
MGALLAMGALLEPDRPVWGWSRMPATVRCGGGTLPEQTFGLCEIWLALSQNRHVWNGDCDDRMRRYAERADDALRVVCAPI